MVRCLASSSLRYYKLTLVLIIISIVLIYAFPRVAAHAQSKVRISYETWKVAPPLSVLGLISRYSDVYGISSSTLLSILRCESQLNPKAIGDYGTSFGIAQIHLPDHPEVTKLEAFDPQFAIPWTAQKISTGQIKLWSCAVKLGYT